ncbi:hypothetical protein JCM17960_00250 [Magnetospira thiophila]
MTNDCAVTCSMAGKDRQTGSGCHPGMCGADLMIAATALEHGLAVVTRNVRHFEPTGVPVVNPFG